jgi:predicted RNA polymerase sigma factor
VAQRIVRAKKTLAEANVPFDLPRGPELGERLASVLEVIYLASGEPVLLLEQDRSRWDRLLIHRGLAALATAEALGVERGPYALQAAITACHARALTPEATDFESIAALYDELVAIHPSPVVKLNRAVAVGMARGPAVGLGLVDALSSEPQLSGYHFLPSARAEFLERLGRLEEARAEFERAAELAQNARQKERLLQRAAACRRPSSC